jgi:hypothetical protein
MQENGWAKYNNLLLEDRSKRIDKLSIILDLKSD